MRILIAFDAVDDATKSVVKIIADVMKDKRWRLDCYDVSEVQREDVATSDLLVVGGSTEITTGEDVYPATPPMVDFLKFLKQGSYKWKLAVPFDTKYSVDLAGSSASTFIEEELRAAGFKIIHPALTLTVERDKPLKIGHVKFCESFTKALKKKVLGTLARSPIDKEGKPRSEKYGGPGAV